MMALEHAPDYDAYESNPDQFGQYLLRVYRNNGPVIRTVAWRQSPMDTWGPEHILFASPVAATEVAE